MTAPLRVPPGRIAPADLVSIVQAYNDVTEQLKRSHDALAREVGRLREALHEKNKELQRRQRLAALGQMAAGVAHEIRNPLGGIRLYASLLDDDLADRPKQRELVGKLAAGIANVERIVSDILAFAGDGDPRRQPVSLGKILEAALGQTQAQLEARRIELVVDPALKAVVLFCDAGQIARALVNLILNAVEAVDPGGRLWIRLAAAEPLRNGEAERLCPIAVEDNGPGIAPDLMQRVFDPFFTAKETGTGLGLAIVHRIAESNGGSVRAGRRAGGGASFVLAVPVARECQGHDITGEDE